jgi:hypothetical protein
MTAVFIIRSLPAKSINVNSFSPLFGYLYVIFILAWICDRFDARFIENRETDVFLYYI